MLNLFIQKIANLLGPIEHANMTMHNYVKTDPPKNIKWHKENSTEKIDSAVTLIMELDRVIINQNRGSGYYARGILVP